MLRRFINTLVRLWRGRRGQVPPTPIVVDSVTAMASHLIQEEVERAFIGTTPIRPTESPSTLTAQMLTDDYARIMREARVTQRDMYRSTWWSNVNYLRGRRVHFTPINRTTGLPGTITGRLTATEGNLRAPRMYEDISIRDIDFEALRTHAERMMALPMMYVSSYQHPQRLGVITSIDEPAVTCKCKRHNPMKQKELFA